MIILLCWSSCWGTLHTTARYCIECIVGLKYPILDVVLDSEKFRLLRLHIGGKIVLLDYYIYPYDDNQV